MKYFLHGIDAWGNDNDGFDFNDFTSKNILDTEDCLGTLPDDEFIKWLIDHEWLNGVIEQFYVEDIGHGDGMNIWIYAKNGRPLYQLTDD